MPHNIVQCGILFSDPSLMEKKPYGRKNFFVAIRPAQKWESLGFHET
jgi:hypothetical protein